MFSKKLRIPLFILLVRVAQFALGFSNRMFYIVLAIGILVMIIIIGFTHSDEIPSEEAAENLAKKLQEMNSKKKHNIDISTDENGNLIGSGHKPPKGI